MMEIIKQQVSVKQMNSYYTEDNRIEATSDTMRQATLVQPKVWRNSDNIQDQLWS